MSDIVDDSIKSGGKANAESFYRRFKNLNKKNKLARKRAQKELRETWPRTEEGFLPNICTFITNNH